MIECLAQREEKKTNKCSFFLSNLFVKRKRKKYTQTITGSRKHTDLTNTHRERESEKEKNEIHSFVKILHQFKLNGPCTLRN
jgi:hypothetical protein